ncbi:MULTISPECIES: glycosyltransferase [Pseudomonadota]|jgi:glycosyltransferase involved in cell wall biosynthesis|uniref:glycosyltransferase n=2 Tax=Pseudomonadota TaxID=1224 RepID=UPI00076A6446|nr:MULTISPECIES: glycosyltransferase [Pseudomonadota]MAF62896.1 glycosyl transferase family 2 [Blastomonas sp.]|tara:strand:- start:149680 stop:150675 length:996 start_codon:yes stop_codon:yes gene_type:complete
MSSPDTPLISVMMSVYNAERYVAEAIQSILGQTEGRFEFLIVNDGSRDASGSIIDRYAAQDSRIRAIHQENRGLIASLNRMLDEARAPLVARMDSDDVSRPERFAVQLAWMQAHPDIAVLGTNTDELDADGAFFPCSDFHPEHPADIRERLMAASAMCHPSVMMRRDVIRSLGGYRAAFRHCEDYDLWLRVSERHDLYNLPDRLFLYRRSPDQVSEKHILVQAIGAACARYAAQQRRAGLPDPFEGATSLPSLDQIDAVLGSNGVGARMRLEVIDSIKYSPEAMSGGGLELMQAHLRDGGTKQGFWRTAGRMVKMGMIPQALTLSLDLMRY